MSKAADARLVEQLIGAIAAGELRGKRPELVKLDGWETASLLRAWFQKRSRPDDRGNWLIEAKHAQEVVRVARAIPREAEQFMHVAREALASHRSAVIRQRVRDWEYRLHSAVCYLRPPHIDLSIYVRAGRASEIDEALFHGLPYWNWMSGRPMYFDELALKSVDRWWQKLFSFTSDFISVLHEPQRLETVLERELASAPHYWPSTRQYLEHKLEALRVYRDGFTPAWFRGPEAVQELLRTVSSTLGAVAAQELYENPPPWSGVPRAVADLAEIDL